MRKVLRLRYAVVLGTIVAVMGVMGILCLAAEIPGFEVTDDFSSGELDLSVWSTVIRFPEWGAINIVDGRLYLSTEGGSDTQEVIVMTKDMFFDDFEVEVEWEIDKLEKGDTARNGLWVIASGSDLALIQRVHGVDGHVISGIVLVGGAMRETPVIETTAMKGKFKIARTGSTIRLYYAIGDDPKWIQFGDDHTEAFTGEIFARIDIASWSECPDVLNYYDNFRASEM